MIRHLAMLFAVLAAAVGQVACQKGKEVDKEPAADEAEIKAETPPPNPHEQAPVPAPADVAAAPADAQKTESGLAYKVLTPGKGGESPGKNDTVIVHYTGWKPSGEMVYTTATRGQPQPMSLAQTAPGWSEALQMMTVGEKRRLWLPAELAYLQNRPGPKEDLVFEVELVDIQKAPPVPEDVAAAPADAKKTKSGLAMKTIKKGSGGDKPRPFDEVLINYTGWTTEGEMFDSTSARGRPVNAPVFRVMPGWQEALVTMTKGEVKRLWVPPELADKNPAMPEGMAVYEIELVEIKKQTEPPPVPKSVATPPKDAKKTEAGVSYKVLEEGKGDTSPTKSDRVRVHYTGWTTDGKMFDSSVVRGEPAEFPVGGVIPGWTDALQQMKKGAKWRIWIPEEMAYKGAPGRPQGMLVFDVELLDIMSSGQPPNPVAPTE